MTILGTVGLFRWRLQYPGPSGSPLSSPVPRDARRSRRGSRIPAVLALILALVPRLGAAAAAAATPVPPAPLPDVGSSVLRLLGALVFVIGLFLAAVWAMRRWQQTSAVRRHGPRLVVLDVQSLGGRQSLYVVAYDRQRLLVGSSPQGVTLVSHLPEADEEATAPGPQASFATALNQILNRKAG